MKDEIYEYYSRQRSKIKALEERIEELEKTEWGNPSPSLRCEIMNLAAVSGDPALHSSLRCSRSFGASDLVAPNGGSPKGRINMKKEKKRWRARVNQPYYVLDLDGSIERMREDGYIADTDVWEFGNYFKTREDAEKARRKIRKVLRNL